MPNPHSDRRAAGSPRSPFKIVVAADDLSAKLTRRGCPPGSPPKRAELCAAATAAGIKIPLPKGIETRLNKAWDKLGRGDAALILVRAHPPSPPTSGRWELRDDPPLPAPRGEPIARWRAGGPGRDGVTVGGKRIRAPEGDTTARPATARVQVLKGGAAATARIFGLPVLREGLLDLRPMIAISPDRLTATATIPPVLAGTVQATPESLARTIRDCGVIHGLDEASIRTALAKAKASGKSIADVEVARGRAVKRGEVSRHKFYVAEDEVLPRDSIIGSRISAATGHDGQDVTGRRIRFDSTERPELRPGPGVELDAETNDLVATRFGRMRFLGDSVALRPLVKIANDRLSATMEALPVMTVARRDENGAIDVKKEEMRAEILTDALIGEGIAKERLLPEEIENLARECRDLEPDAELGPRRVVARGIEPVPGDDARVTFEFTVRGEDPNRFIGDPEFHAADQWAGAGQKLASKKPAAPGTDGLSVTGETIEAESGRDILLEAGDGVVAEADGLSFSASGPETSLPALQAGTLCTESMVGIADDLLSASFPRDAAPEGLVVPDRAGIDAALERAGVVHGIDEEALNALAARAGEAWRAAAAPIALATGTEPEHGDPARFICHIDTRNRFEGAEGDEQVDFREMIHSRAVEAGHHLASRVPPTRGGASGISVLGTEIPCRDGEDLTPRAGRGVRLSSDELEYFAAREGVYNQQQDVVEVLENYVVEGDVDFAVGHIDSKCMVTIEGTVAAGFEVRAGGPVFVGKSVEDGLIHSPASVYVGEGVYFASRAEVHAGQDVDVAVVDRALIVAQGDVLVRREAINADIRTLGTLRFGRGKSRGVGGSLRAAQRIEAEKLGSELGARTFVEVGATVGLREDAPPEPPEGGWTTLIPQRGTYPATVRVRGEVFPGTIIKILSWSLELEETLAGVEFYLDANWIVRSRPLACV